MPLLIRDFRFLDKYAQPMSVCGEQNLQATRAVGEGIPTAVTRQGPVWDASSFRELTHPLLLCYTTSVRNLIVLILVLRFLHVCFPRRAHLSIGNAGADDPLQGAVRPSV